MLFHSGYSLGCIASVFQLGKHPWRPKQSIVLDWDRLSLPANDGLFFSRYDYS